MADFEFLDKVMQMVTMHTGCTCNRENFGGGRGLFAVLPALLNYLTESTFYM